MNQKIKRIRIYFLMTMLMVISAGAVLYVAGKPVLDYILSYINFLITKGAP
jgi:uncharacterized BrkB/YihY/UPF0761 family membrane protein